MMPILGIRITARGRLQLIEERREKLSFKRQILLSVAGDKDYVGMDEIRERIKSIAGAHPETVESLLTSLYSDINKLYRMEAPWLEVAHWKAPNGQLFEWKPQGMMFAERHQ